MCANPPTTLDDRRRALVRCPRARAMAARIAHRFSHGRGPDDYEDYLGAAVSGLAEAAARFDFALPLTRSTLEESYCGFAYVYALNAVVDLRRQEQAASRHMQEYVARLRREGLDADEPCVTDEDRATAGRLRLRPETVSRERRRIACGDARPVGGFVPIDGLAPSAEDEAMGHLRDAAVRAAIDALPRPLRDVMALRCEGYGRTEIAEQLGLGEWRAKDLLTEGFTLLRVALSEYAAPPDEAL